MESVEYYPPREEETNMSRMNEASQQEDERENLSGMDDYNEWLESQKALPEHKRDGYAERQYEIAEDLIKRLREEGL